ncbi:copper amine oxidase N-terminal domain-containing protein [Neomoorella humiferrea]|uniref:copper amine oxidase N-terminal domain-containing protein n=1 Tax=Neomoorella humiferrea TaxID=676965 RepID=UPI003D9072FF
MRRENSTNKRPVVVVLMVLAAIFLFVCPAWAGGDNIAVFTIGKTSYLLNGVTFDMDVAPYIKDGRTYIPLRYVAKAMGITDENIIWDPKMKKVMIVKENQVVQLIIGSNELTINGKVVVMDVAPEVIAGRVMLPIRWLAHSLGVSIEWDSVSKTITVGGSNETAKAGTLSGDNGQEKALEKPVVDYKAILKEYKWYH